MDTADIVLLGGRVWTGRAAAVDAEALAIQADRIVAVGSNERIAELCGPATRRVWLEGLLVTPGFHDSHVHFASGSRQLQQVYLKDAPDRDEFGRRLREFDRCLPKGEWLLGGRWDHDFTFSGKLPTARLVDEYVADRPVFLRRYDGHMGLANSVALQMATITRNTPDPPGGKIVRDQHTGEPTGILQDRAMDLVQRLIPAPDSEQLPTAMRAGLKEAARRGITSVHDMLGEPDGPLRAYRRLAEAGDLSLRAYLYWPIARWQEAVEVPGQLSPQQSSLRICGVKAFVDGSLGSHTAWFHEPYADNRHNYGLPIADLRELGESMRQAEAAGLQLAVHAIGDRAVSELLNLWEQIAASSRRRDRRLRMEHAQHVRAADRARMVRLGVIASMQPYHAIDDARWAEERIGPARCREAYAFRSLLEAGIPLAFGSDWPVAPLDVLAGVDAAVNRQPLGLPKRDSWHPEQRITVAEALCAYTGGAAYAVSCEDRLGRLEPGKLADLAVLSRDITDPDNREAITETEVLLTVVGGRIVYNQLT